MENKEYEQTPQKDNKSLHLIFGIVIGAVIATAIVLAVLFATGVIGGEKESTTTANTTETVAVAEKETTAKISSESKPNTSEGKYSVFKLENILVYYIDDNRNILREENKTVTLQIPYLDEYKFLGLDLDSLEIDVNNVECVTNGKYFGFSLDFYKGETDTFALSIAYSGDTFIYDNVLTMSVDSSAVPYNGQERWVDCYYLGPDKVVTTEMGIDDEFVYRRTYSRYEYKNGTYYDKQGNVITEEEYKAEEEKSRKEANASLKKYL